MFYCSYLQVACGLDHTLLLGHDGRVMSCGWGADGQTGKSVTCTCMCYMVTEWLSVTLKTPKIDQPPACIKHEMAKLQNGTTVDKINWEVVFKGELLQLLRTNHCHVSDI